MKLTVTALIAAITVAGCSTTTQTDQQTAETPPNPAIQSTEPHPNYLLCRRDNPAELERVMQSALNAKGTLLYFHGGLSGDSYMRNELGPALLESVFTENNLNGLHPVFMNYEVSPFQTDNLKDVLKDAAFAKLRDIILARIDEESNKKANKVREFEVERSAEQRAALSILLDQGQEMGKEFVVTPRSEEDYEVFLTKILTDDTTLESVAENLSQDPAINASAAEFEALSNRSKSDGEKLSFDKSFITLSGSKAITRSLARFALTLNHQIVPTITEEVFRALTLLDVISVEKGLQTHWQTVKRHSQQCWGPDSNGRALVTALLAKKAADPTFTINVMSHSAGSLVIGKLVELLGAEFGSAHENTIDNAVLVVPAISAELFQQSFMKHNNVIKKLRVFPLTDEKEKNDSLIPILYPASLLYGVSGIGETNGFGDKPLMIQRHMGMKRYPYSKWLYRRVFEDIREMWKFVDANPEVFDFYPFSESESEGATHKLTKLTWCSKPLAKRSMSELTGIPEEQIEVKDVDVKCE